MKSSRDLAVVRSAVIPATLLPPEVRKAIASHSTATDDGAWDGPANEARLDNDAGAATYRKAYAWQDPDADADTKAAYKFIHHFVDSDGTVGAASTKGCTAGIAVLNGGRGGADIPDADRQGVYNHLARHLRDAGMEPPELNSLPPEGAALRASYRADHDPGDSPTMTVAFSAFGVWYEIDSFFEGRFLERVAPGAFVKTINERGGQVKVLFNHGFEFDIGDKILGPISLLEERETGPYGEVPLLDTSYNADLIPGLRAGVYGSSFMFNVLDDQWEYEPERSDHNPDGLPERTITTVRLLEFGPVTWPANPQATAGLRGHTDTYAERVRARSPERYESLAERFAAFRAEHRLAAESPTGGPTDPAPADSDVTASTSPDDEAVPGQPAADATPVPEPAPAADQAEDTTQTEEAANDPTDAPDPTHSGERHAAGLSADQRAAQLRGLQLKELVH